VRDTLAAARDNAESACTQLMNALIGARKPDDDVTLLVLRRT
jgi:hypothetical protein